MGIPDHLTCLLRNLCAGQEASVRTGHGTIDQFQIGKGVCQGCILSPCLFNLYAEYIRQNAGWMKHKLESRLLGEISTTSDMQMTPSLQQKEKRNYELLDESGRGEGKSQVKTQHNQKKKLKKLRSLEKTSMLGKIEGKRSNEGQRMDMNLSKFREILKDSLVCCCPWGLRVLHDLATEQQQQFFFE